MLPLKGNIKLIRHELRYELRLNLNVKSKKC